jgi:hypothetical protein
MPMAVEPRIDGDVLPQPHPYRPENAPAGEVTIVTMPRVIEMYSISEHELDQMGRAPGALAVNLVFFGIAFGASLAFLLSLVTQDLTNRQVALVWALFALTLATVYFGIMAMRHFWDAGRGVRAVKRQNTKPAAP